VVTGDRGQVEATVPGTEVFLSDRAAGTHRAIPAPLSPLVREVGFHHGASYLEHLAFLEALQSGAPARVTVEDGRLAVAIGLAAQQSIATGRPVNLSELEGFSA
jgi:myo-inositol 2-dehydrogenase/D-chiro-inositol 1-dehydrogenase